MTRPVLLLDIGAGDLPATTPTTPTASSWFPVPYTAAPLPAPGNTSGTPLANSVLLQWDAVAGADGYTIERGPTAAGPWTYVTTIGAPTTRYTYSDGTSTAWHFRITPVVRGINGNPSQVQAAPVAPASLQALVDLQAEHDQEVEDRLAGDLAEAQERADAIAAEQSARTAAIAAEAQDRIDAIAAEHTQWSTAITTEQTQRSTADNLLAQSIATLAAGTGEQFDSRKVWYFDADLESWTGNGAPTVSGGYMRPANHATDPYVASPTGTAVVGDSYRYVKAKIRRTGNPAWVGELRWRRTTDAAGAWQGPFTIPAPSFQADGDATIDFKDIPWSATIDQIRLDLTSAQDASNYIQIDWVAIGRATPGASIAALQEEASARIEADAAEATQRTTLAAQLRGTYTGSDINAITSGLLHSERVARVGADAAMASEIDVLQARMPGGSDVLATVAELTNEATVRAAADSANASNIISLQAGLNVVVPQGLSASFKPNSLNDWIVTIGGTVEVTYPAQATAAGGYVLRVGNNSGDDNQWARHKQTMPLDPNKLYRVRYRYRRVSGTGGVYLGLACRNADNTQYVSSGNLIGGTLSGAHYFVTNATPALGVWVEGEAYFKGRSAGAWTGVGTITNPYTFAAQSAHFSPMFIANYQNLAGECEFDYIVIEDADALGMAAGNANAVSALDARVSDAEGLITAQSSSITLLEASLSNNITVVNPGFEYDTGWGGLSGAGYNLQNNATEARGGNRYLRKVPVAGDTTQARDSTNQFFAVKGGQQIRYGGYVRAFNTISATSYGFIVVAYDTVGGLVGSNGAGLAGGAAHGWQLAEGVWDVPATAAVVHLRCRVVGHTAGTIGFDDTYVQMVDPKAAGAATASAMEELDARVVQAEGGITAFKASHTITLDVNGNVSGTRSENDGTTSSFSILATVFRVISNLSGMGMEWQNGYLRMWKGSAQLLLGHTFGVNGDLVFWYGPNIGAAACTKANGTIWFDTSGGAYFGGTLSAGVLKNGAQSSQVSGTASVESGNFGTNGNAKTVVASLSYTNGGLTSSAPWGGGSNGVPQTTSATLTIQRSLNGGAWTNVASTTVTGQRMWTLEGGDYVSNVGCSGSVTYTDNTAGAGPFNYRAILSSPANWPWTIGSSQGTQRLSILSTEQ